MWLDLNSMVNNCPKELEKSLKEIKFIALHFLDKSNLYPQQWIEEAKIDIQESKVHLLQMLSRFLTMIHNYYHYSENNMLQFGLKQMFEENIGLIIRDLKDKQLGAFKNMITFSSLLTLSGEFLTIFDFIIYNPIITVNKVKHLEVNDYIEKLLKIVQSNANVLGYANKTTISIPQPSQSIVPKSTMAIKTFFTSKEQQQNESKELTEEKDPFLSLDMNDSDEGDKDSNV